MFVMLLIAEKKFLVMFMNIYRKGNVKARNKMLTLKCLATGSSGNCYLLSSETETLILDCGIPIIKIKRGLNYDLRRISGVVVTHSHL